MAKFKMVIIKHGTENKENNYRMIASVGAVELEEGDEELRFPETYEGLPVTHIGCDQDYKEACVEHGDWHHSTHRDDTYVPARFCAKHTPIHLPASVKRVYIPAAAEVLILYASPDTVFEIHPDNETFGLRPDGSITQKCFL